MTTLAQLHDCHSCNDERSIVQKKKRLPQKVTLDLHQIVPLPRKATLELHQVLPLP